MKSIKTYIQEALISSKTKIKKDESKSPVELICELLCLTKDTAINDYTKIIQFLNNVWKNKYNQFDIDNIKCVGYRYSSSSFESDIKSMSQYNRKLEEFYEFNDHEKFMKLYSNGDDQKIISRYYQFNFKSGKFDSDWIFDCYETKILTWYKHSHWGIITLE